MPIIVGAALVGVALHLVLRPLLRLAARLRLHDRLVAGADRIARRGCHAGARLRPARHGSPAREHRRQGDVHLLRPGVRVALQQAGFGRSHPAARLRPQRQRHPAGLDPQPRARRARGPLHRIEHRRDGRGAGPAARVLRCLPAGPRVRHAEGRHRAGHRPLRPDVDAVPGDRLGPGPDPRHVRPGQDPGLLAAMGREDEPGAAMRGAEPQRQRGSRADRRRRAPARCPARRRASVPSATPLAIPVPSSSLAPSPS